MCGACSAKHCRLLCTHWYQRDLTAGWKESTSLSTALKGDALWNQSSIFSCKHVWLAPVPASTSGAVKSSHAVLGRCLLPLSSPEVLPGLMAEESVLARLAPAQVRGWCKSVQFYWFTCKRGCSENSTAHHSTTIVHAITNAATKILIKLKLISKGCAELLTEGLPCWEKNYKHNRISTVII